MVWLFAEERLKQNDLYKAFPPLCESERAQWGCSRTNKQPLIHPLSKLKLAAPKGQRPMNMILKRERINI